MKDLFGINNWIASILDRKEKIIMRILIISSTCSKRKYKEICDKRLIKSLDTNQKFFLSIINGLQQNGCDDITCITVLPVSFSTYPERRIKQYIENEDGINYIYCETYNYPIIRNLYASFQVLKLVKAFLKDNRDDELYIITDALFYEFSQACKYIHYKNKKVFTIVTDIPNCVSNMSYRKSLKGLLLTLYGQMATLSIRNNYDGYIFLTEKMADVCNPTKKPYIVIEGLLSNYKRIEKEINSEESLPIVLYAGKYNIEFGSLLLANAAPLLKGICNIKMYGAGGTCVNELKQVAQQNDNLDVNGIIPLEELLELETKVDLLINPRPAGQDFTKYSFPSKTLEYMASGTPVLMYKLEGIPEEYDKYLYYISGTTSKDIANSVLSVLSTGKIALYNKGMSGKKFVVENKNCNIQTKKILNFVRKYG